MMKLWIGTKKVPQKKRFHNDSTQGKKVPNAPKGFTYGNADTESFASEASAKFFAFLAFPVQKRGQIKDGERSEPKF